jgi:hypothetical protein
MVRFLIVLFCLALNSSAIAQWKQEVRDQILASAKENFVEGPPGYVSLWGGIRRKWEGGSPKGEMREYFVDKLMKKEKLDIYFHQAQKQAPLTIVFPGIFGTIKNKDLTINLVSQLERNETHVAVIPNFLSTEYIEAGPIYEDDVAKTDIQIASLLVEKILKSIPHEVLEINFVAESLGTFVATASLVELQKRELFRNLKFNLILMWPPMQLKKVLQNFDRNIMATKNIFDECQFWYRYPLAFYHFIWHKKPMTPSDDFVKCMDSYLYHGVFGEGIRKSIIAHTETNKIKLEMYPKNFADFFQSYNQHFYKMLSDGDERLNLNYWLSKRNQTQTNVKIVTSVDDFLNEGLQWNEFLPSAYLEEKNLIILPWGAHSAGLALPVWPLVFKKELFNNTRPKKKWSLLKEST